MNIKKLDDTEDKSVALSDLNFMAIKFPRIIPVDLIESVKGRNFTPDQFITYQETQVDNPFNHLFVLVDSSKKIHGFLWAESSMLDGALFVNTFSVSKTYWGKGAAISIAIEFIRELSNKLKSPRVYWSTTNEKFFKKHGFKRSRVVFMEHDCQTTRQ